MANMTSVPQAIPRPGGRSARVQAAVHQATDELLADVAVERLRPDGDPLDTGSVAGDLQAWVEQYRDEMSSDIGLGMMLDVLSAKGGSVAEGHLPVPCQCSAFTASQIATIVARGIERGEAVPEVDAVMDTVVSPIVYRALFGSVTMTPAQAQALVTACLKTVRKAKAVV